VRAVAEPRRILITGSSGFVGRHLLPLLNASFPGVQIFTNRMDVTSRDEVIESVRDARPDACIHLAAISSVPAARRDPESTWCVNLLGTLNVAQVVLELLDAAIVGLHERIGTTATTASRRPRIGWTRLWTKDRHCCPGTSARDV
jgi:nucleoside-diphosphate-sugar epimerase